MRNILLGGLLLLLVSSCKKNAVGEQQYRHWLVESVAGGGTINVNDTLPLTVFWPYSNGCDLVDKFEENRKSSVIYIKAMGYNRGGICTMDAGIKATSYKFVAPSAGTYELRFLRPDSSFIAHTVQVQ